MTDGDEVNNNLQMAYNSNNIDHINRSKLDDMASNDMNLTENNNNNINND